VRVQLDLQPCLADPVQECSIFLWWCSWCHVLLLISIVHVMQKPVAANLNLSHSIKVA